MLLWKYLKFCQGTGCEIPQNRRLTNDRTQQRREITLGVHCGQVEHQGLFLCGEPPLTMRTGLVCSLHFPDLPGIVTASAQSPPSQLPLQCPVSLLRWMLGCRQPLSSTIPKANRQLTARRLPLARELFCFFLLTFSPEWAILVLIN